MDFLSLAAKAILTVVSYDLGSCRRIHALTTASIALSPHALQSMLHSLCVPTSQM